MVARDVGEVQGVEMSEILNDDFQICLYHQECRVRQFWVVWGYSFDNFNENVRRVQLVGIQADFLH